jgi:hypothetical protein
VAITVSWVKGPAVPGGPITVETKVYATNPSHRLITVNVTDEIRSGTTVLDTATSGDVDVPANTANFLLLTHTTTVPAGTTNLNDVATATYTDKVTGIPVPGSTTATASATPTNTGPELNQTAVITDTESITGTGLTFSVATPSVGSFTGGYVAGTPTTGPVGWSSGTQSASGSVTFNKTVYVDEPRITSGSLTDTATLTGSDGATASDTATVTITTSATTTLTIDKTIPDVLGTGETATFTFDVCAGTGACGSGNAVASPSITFTAGETEDSVDVTGLAPGTYTVHERTTSGWAPRDDQVQAITLPSCAETVTFNNGFAPANAQVRKVTIPAGSEAGWEFTLTGPNTPSGGEVVTTTGTGFVDFTTVLEEGSYTITETDGPPGWDQTGASTECSFTVDFPADAGHTFSCTFTNTQRGSVTVIKTQNGATPTLGYTFCLSGGPDNLPTTNCLTTNSTNQGTLDFGEVKPGNYTLCEKAVPAGTDSTLVDQGGVLDPNTGDVCLNLTVDPGEDVVFNVDNSFPLGGQRTIGYWKNWNTCAKATAAKALKTGNHLMDEFLPQQLGPYTVSTACQGVAVLKASSMKYAENGTAAQLLGAKLNVAAGAGTCPAILTAIQTADNLLTSIGYDGPGGAQVVGSGHPLRSQFNAVHSTLDRYNNGLLC